MAEMTGIRCFLESSFCWRVKAKQTSFGREKDQQELPFKEETWVPSTKKESLTANEQI